MRTVYSKEEIEKLSNAYTESRMICKCGHSQAILPSKAKEVCEHCGQTIWNNSRARLRFLFFTNEELKKQFVKE